MKLLSLVLVLVLLLPILPAAAVEEVSIDSPLEETPVEEILPESPPEEAPLEETPLESLPSSQIQDSTESDLLQTPELALSAESGPQLYFGQLHAHSALSGGLGTPEEAYAWARDVAELDFFALTDHSDSFDNAASAQIGTDACTLSASWAAGRAAARAASTAGFTALFGYEMSWPRQKQLGHISTFATAGFQSWDQSAFSSPETGLEAYYQALAGASGSVSQFNHPGTLYGSFCDFGHYSEAADGAISLLEVFSGEAPVGQPGCFSAQELYARALDKGWHLAPSGNQANHQGAWGTANSLRTAIWADSLAEADLLAAIRDHRVYATEDSDLSIHYTLDGHFMGSRLSSGQVGETVALCVTLSDPTDPSAGLVEVITEEGRILASQTLEESSGNLTFSLPAGYRYYYLKITQPDGDTAITAPVWIRREGPLEITAIRCETAVPVQAETLQLILEISNGTSSDYRIHSAAAREGDVLLGENTAELRIPAGEQGQYALTLSRDRPGSAQIEAVISGTFDGSARGISSSISLFFRQSSQVSHVLVDGVHGGAAADSLAAFTALAAGADIRVTVARQEITLEMLENAGLLVIPPPEIPFSSEYLNLLRKYTAWGGTILLWGQADSQDSGLSTAAHLNRLLKALGSSMSLQDDLATDPVHNGGSSDLLLTGQIRSDCPWCAHLCPGQVYRHHRGCTLDPGRGTWLVQGQETACSIDGDADGKGGSSPPVTLLAVEDLAEDGRIFAAGAAFLSDPELESPENLWDLPFANHTIARNLLGMAQRELPLATIRQAREAPAGTMLRIRGHVTAGTSIPANTFPQTLYLQDDTGGIAVTPFPDTGIPLGTPLEITGVTGSDGNNPIVTLGSYRILSEESRRYLPLTGQWDTLLDPALSGGRLVQAEGTCTQVFQADSGRFTGCILTDSAGNRAQILVEPGIGSLSTGENTLSETVREGRTIRAMGILHVTPEGDTVIRVRNCEEVVYVPPKAVPADPDYTNPKTGDSVGRFLIFGTSLAVFPAIWANLRRCSHPKGASRRGTP